MSSDEQPSIEELPRPRPRVRRHLLIDGETWMPLDEFCTEVLGISARTGRRQNFRTMSHGGIHYVPRDASLAELAERAKRRKEEPKRRRTR